MMNRVSYIDTRPGAGIFSMPAGQADYAAWLQTAYKQASRKQGDKRTYYGVAQKINACIYQARRKTTLIAFGPYAGSAAKAIEEIAEHGIIVEVVV